MVRIRSDPLLVPVAQRLSRAWGVFVRQRTVDSKLVRTGGIRLIKTKYRWPVDPYRHDVIFAQCSECQSEEIQVSAGKRREQLWLSWELIPESFRWPPYRVLLAGRRAFGSGTLCSIPMGTSPPYCQEPLEGVRFPLSLPPYIGVTIPIDMVP